MDPRSEQFSNITLLKERTFFQHFHQIQLIIKKLSFPNTINNVHRFEQILLTFHYFTISLDIIILLDYKLVCFYNTKYLLQSVVRSLTSSMAISPLSPPTEASKTI